MNENNYKKEFFSLIELEKNEDLNYRKICHNFFFN